jgi:hypothetical protein
MEPRFVVDMRNLWWEAAAMADRESGAYWIRDTGGDWVVAYWEGDPRVAEWYGFGDDRPIDSKWIAEIGERVERRSVTADATLAGRLVDFEEWPEPQPITDAQKTGERFLVWNDSEHPDTCGWFTAFYDGKIDGWLTGALGGYTELDRVTAHLPLPPDVKP